MHQQLTDKLTSLLTNAMREAIRARRLDPARVPFKVHVAERAVNGAVFLGVSFPTLSKRASVRASFWNAIARLPFGFRASTSTETWLEMPTALPGAEHVAAFAEADILRALEAEARFAKVG